MKRIMSKNELLEKSNMVCIGLDIQDELERYVVKDIVNWVYEKYIDENGSLSDYIDGVEFEKRFDAIVEKYRTYATISLYIYRRIIVNILFLF